MTLKYEPAVGEDLNLGVSTVTVTNPGGGTLNGTQISLSTFSRTGPSAQAIQQAWTPGTIAAGQSVSTTVTVQGSVLGDFVVATFDQIGTSSLVIGAQVSTAGTVTVVIANPTAVAVTLGAGTLRVLDFLLR